MNLFDEFAPIPTSIMKAISFRGLKIDEHGPYYVRSFERSHFDNRDRYVAQSILCGIIDKPELPSAEEAADIIQWASKAKVQ